MASVEPLLESAALGVAITLDIETAPATSAYAWPSAPTRARTSWHEQLASALFRLVTPTIEGVTLPNFGWLGPTLYRGAQPGRMGLQALKGMDVDTIINLRAESNDEATLVRQMGFDYRYFPMDPFAMPSHAQVLAFLHAVADPRAGRVYFHCYHGADRTGVLAACYRLAHDGWSLRDALTEMSAHGFHHAFMQSKLLYVRQFANYWAQLPAEVQDEVLHR